MHAKQPNKSALDLRAFAPSTLTDSEGLTAALRMLKSCLAEPDIPLDLIVQDLCAVPNLFEYIVSGEFSVLVLRILRVSDSCLAFPGAEGLVQRILDTYPADPALVEGSSASMLLRRLSSVIFALPPDIFPTDTIRHAGQYKVYVENALPVLTLSCSTDFSTSITADATLAIAFEDPEYNDEEFLGGYVVRNKKQKKSKRKNKNAAPIIDVAPFHKLEVKVPLDNTEASQIASEISDDLKMILKVRRSLCAKYAA